MPSTVVFEEGEAQHKLMIHLRACTEDCIMKHSIFLYNQSMLL